MLQHQLRAVVAFTVKSLQLSVCSAQKDLTALPCLALQKYAQREVTALLKLLPVLIVLQVITVSLEL